jgi:hypothetical protein
MVKRSVITFLTVLLLVPATSRGRRNPVAEDKEPLRCANLTYAGSKSSVCSFCPQFAERQTAIRRANSRRSGLPGTTCSNFRLPS